MQFVDRLVIAIARPVYYAFFARPLWWFLAKVKAFFFAETSVALENIQRRLEDQGQQRWAASEERLRNLEANNAAKWDAMEQLLLSLFRQSEVQTAEPEWKFSVSNQVPDLNTATDPNRAHAASNLR